MKGFRPGRLKRSATAVDALIAETVQLCRDCETLFSHGWAICPNCLLQYASLGTVRHGRSGLACLAIRGAHRIRPDRGAMQKRRVDSLLYGSIVLLAFSILGFIYLLWQTYRMAAK